MRVATTFSRVDPRFFSDKNTRRREKKRIFSFHIPAVTSEPFYIPSTGIVRSGEVFCLFFKTLRIIIVRTVVFLKELVM